MSLWIGWTGDDTDDTVHLASPLALKRMGTGRWWQLWRRTPWWRWPACCGVTLTTLTVGSLADDVTCCDCEVARIRSRAMQAALGEDMSDRKTPTAVTFRAETGRPGQPGETCNVRIFCNEEDTE